MAHQASRKPDSVSQHRQRHPDRQTREKSKRFQEGYVEEITTALVHSLLPEDYADSYKPMAKLALSA